MIITAYNTRHLFTNVFQLLFKMTKTWNFTKHVAWCCLLSTAITGKSEYSFIKILF